MRLSKHSICSFAFPRRWNFQTDENYSIRNFHFSNYFTWIATSVGIPSIFHVKIFSWKFHFRIEFYSKKNNFFINIQFCSQSLGTQAPLKHEIPLQNCGWDRKSLWIIRCFSFKKIPYFFYHKHNKRKSFSFTLDVVLALRGG